MASEKRSGALAPGVAFITGGARGLGNAVAVSFAREGARGVVIVDIQDEQTFKKGRENVEAFGTECLTIRCDVTKEDEVESAVAQAVKKFGRIDYTANFAGVVGPGEHVHTLNLSDFQQTMAVNTTGVFLSQKHELIQMLKQDSIDVETGRTLQRGSIVNCASVNSIQAVAGSAAYTASKHAVMGLTKAAALEVRAHGIRVNAVSPGFLRTPMIANLLNLKDEQDKIRDASGEKSLSLGAWETFEKRQGRQALFEEIGDVVVLLSTPRMSLVNGHNLVIDGGFTINEGSL